MYPPGTHLPSSTTHTRELDQLMELNRALRAVKGPPSAAELGMRDAGEAQVGELPANAELFELDWFGPPAYPYIQGHFRIGERSEPVVTDLHSATLRTLSQRLGLRHVWGI